MNRHRVHELLRAVFNSVTRLTLGFDLLQHHTAPEPSVPSAVPIATEPVPEEPMPPEFMRADDLPVLFTELAGTHLAAVSRNAGGSIDDMRGLVRTVYAEAQRLWCSEPRPHSVEVKSYDLFFRAPSSPSEVRLGLLMLDSGDGKGFQGVVFDPREQVSLVQSIFRGHAFQVAGEPQH